MVVSNPDLVRFGVLIVMLLFVLALYVYFSLTMMIVAKRLKTKRPWLAWIPVANIFLLTSMAKLPWWPMLFLIPSIILFIIYMINGAYWAMVSMMLVSLIPSLYSTYCWIKICEFRKRPRWFVYPLVIATLLSVVSIFFEETVTGLVISVFNLLFSVWFMVVLGILAWSKK